MAADTTYNAGPSPPSKRRASIDADALAARSKRRKVTVPQMQYRKCTPYRVPIPADQTIIQKQLSRTISLGLTAAGFNGADPDALESFRLCVEEHMFHQLSDVRISMLLSRRTQPIPQDFLFALQKHRIKNLSDLEPYLQPMIPTSFIQPPLPTPPPEEPPTPPLSPLLGPALSGSRDKEEAAYIPKHFPSFPSKHTYKATPEFTEREKDPRKLRERATEEGRQGEEALRKFVAAANSGSRIRVGGEATNHTTGVRIPAKRDNFAVWEQFVRSALEEQKARKQLARDSGFGGSASTFGGDGTNGGSVVQLSPDSMMPVNWERQYYRKAARTGQNLAIRQKAIPITVAANMDGADMVMDGNPAR